MLLVTIALVLVQEMAVRLGTYTGKGLAALIREQFTLRMTAVALGCVLLANTGLVVSEFTRASGPPSSCSGSAGTSSSRSRPSPSGRSSRSAPTAGPSGSS